MVISEEKNSSLEWVEPMFLALHTGMLSRTLQIQLLKDKHMTQNLKVTYQLMRLEGKVMFNLQLELE